MEGYNKKFENHNPQEIESTEGNFLRLLQGLRRSATNDIGATVKVIGAFLVIENLADDAPLQSAYWKLTSLFIEQDIVTVAALYESYESLLDALADYANYFTQSYPFPLGGEPGIAWQADQRIVEICNHFGLHAFCGKKPANHWRTLDGSILSSIWARPAGTTEFKTLSDLELISKHDINAALSSADRYGWGDDGAGNQIFKIVDLLADTEGANKQLEGYAVQTGHADENSKMWLRNVMAVCLKAGFDLGLSHTGLPKDNTLRETAVDLCSRFDGFLQKTIKKITPAQKREADAFMKDVKAIAEGTR